MSQEEQVCLLGGVSSLSRLLRADLWQGASEETNVLIEMHLALQKVNFRQILYQRDQIHKINFWNYTGFLFLRGCFINVVTKMLHLFQRYLSYLVVLKGLLKRSTCCLHCFLKSYSSICFRSKVTKQLSNLKLTYEVLIYASWYLSKTGCIL